MLMGCILFTVTENSFESLKNWLRLRHTGKGVVEDVVSHEGITQASAGREQKGRPVATPPRNQATGPTVSCEAEETWALGTSVTSNEGEKPFPRSSTLPARTHLGARGDRAPLVTCS